MHNLLAQQQKCIEHAILEYLAIYASCVFWQLYETISNVSDESYEELQKLEYLDWCISENLRLYPPVLRWVVTFMSLYKKKVCNNHKKKN